MRLPKKDSCVAWDDRRMRSCTRPSLAPNPISGADLNWDIGVAERAFSAPRSASPRATFHEGASGGRSEAQTFTGSNPAGCTSLTVKTLIL